MIPHIYHIGIKVYRLLIRVVALKNKKARQWLQGRANIFDYLNQINPDEPLIWIHTASVGEFEQARPIIDRLKASNNPHKILLTFYSPSGYELRKNYNHADYVTYLPLDTKENAKKFLELTKPNITFFVKYDFWPNYLQELQQRNLTHYVISAIFREDNYFFKWYGKWMLSLLSGVTHFFVQNNESKELLKKYNIHSVTVSGDTRYDRVLDITHERKELSKIVKFKGDSPLFIAGSTWPVGEEMILELIKHYGNSFKYIIAPHEIDEAHLNYFEENCCLPTLRYSDISDDKVNNAEVIIIDNIGLLSSLYYYADIAYVGGGFGKGIHNILEAATFGMPIFIGPENRKFEEAQKLKKLGVAFEVKSGQEIIDHCDRLFIKPEISKQIKIASRNFVLNNSGACDTIKHAIF